jgi:hypothetical protein
MFALCVARRPRALAFLDGVVVAFVVVAMLGPVPRADAGQPRALVGIHATALERAREGAARRLARAECQQVFHDFRDGKGRPLAETLATFEKTPADYLRMIPFLDGASHPLCRGGRAYLFTQVGVRRVFVCPAFTGSQIAHPFNAENMVIHELLHTLGLGENPPSSGAITARVNSRCH